MPLFKSQGSGSAKSKSFSNYHKYRVETTTYYVCCFCQNGANKLGSLRKGEKGLYWHDTCREHNVLLEEGTIMGKSSTIEVKMVKNGAEWGWLAPLWVKSTPEQWLKYYE